MFLRGKTFLCLLCWIGFNNSSSREGTLFVTKINIKGEMRERENESLNIAMCCVTQTKLCNREIQESSF